MRCRPTLDFAVVATAFLLVDGSPGGDLDAPIRLEEGEHLWLAVTLPATLPTSTCVRLCAGEPSESGEAFWSNAVSTPYAWAGLETFGILSTVGFSATGHLGE